MVQFQEEFLRLCAASNNEVIVKLPDTISHAIDYLKSLPLEIDEKYMQNKHFEKLLRVDQTAAMIVYWEEIDERIKYLWKSIGLRGNSLLENVVSCVNSKNYYPAAISTRALLENCAYLHFCLMKILPMYTKWTNQDVFGHIIRKEVKRLVISGELENLLILFSHGTTLRVLTSNHPKWKQEGISKYIKSLSEEKGYEDINDYYSLLCQIAHPSIGSNLIFLTKGYFSGNYEVYHFRKDQNAKFFLERIYIRDFNY